MIRNLISLSIEIEGLLRVLEENPSAEAKDLLEEKFEQFSQIFYSEIPSITIPEQKQDTGIAKAVEKVESVESAESVDTTQIVEDSHIPEITATTGVSENPEIDESVDFSEPTDTIKVDEMLSRREARDLTRAFTLNDKFRFTRELFGGNKSEFADTLNMIMAMHSLDEANDYLVTDLGIDPESEAGADFMAIITNHFNGR